VNAIALVRHGFTSPRSRGVDWSGEWTGRVERYKLGEPFFPAWQRALSSSAEYALLVDDAIECRASDLRLLHRVLAANPAVDGLTLDSGALGPVYGIAPSPKSGARIPWTASRLPVLPPWLTLLRIERWRDAAPAETVEFFLLREAERKVAARLDVAALPFDATNWAGDLVEHAGTLLAADYAAAAAHGHSVVPPQFQVTVPGTRQWRADAVPAIGRPCFAIVCPSIRPDFLGETVESVLAQTWDNWELRIGIDGPKEIQLRRIAAVLDPFKSDPRIHIRRYPHGGTGPTRRRLASASRGDFVMTLDDDDRLPPHTLARFAEAIAERPDAVLLRGGTRVFGLCESYLPPRLRYRIGAVSNDLFEVNQPFAVRRDVLEAFGGFEWDPNLKNAGEDSDLFLKIDREQLPVVVIDEPLYERRLSTLNQTLDCTSDECAQHIRFLYGKHNPPGWQLADVRFSDHGTHVGMQTLHRRRDQAEAVVCSTRFMNFQQVGSRDGVVVDLEVTSLCNAVCTFCPRTHLERHARFMSLETVAKVADSIRREKTPPMVVLAGIGESTLHPDLNDIVRILAGAGARVCLTTNGWNLSLDSVDALVAAGLSELNVSLNAASAPTHAAVMQLKNFAGIVESCRSVALARPMRWPALEFHVSFVVTDRNEGEVHDFVEQWQIDGVSQIWLHRLTNRRGLLAPDCRPGDTDGLAVKYADNPRIIVDLFPERDGPANLCRVARGVDFVSVDGDMLLCAQDYESRHKFGNIAHADLGRLHEMKLLTHLRGETAATCTGCTFCPPSFRSAYGGPYSIVQAGAV